MNATNNTHHGNVTSRPAIEEVVAAHRSGMTTQEIGVALGVTGQCVRLWLAKAGITANGLRHEMKLSKSAALQAAKVKAREERCQRRYGCDWQTFKALTGSAVLNRTASAVANLYYELKHNCQNFGVEFQLTFPEYAALIGDRAAEIGRGKIVVARINKRGPYSASNVELRSHSLNSRLTNGFKNAHDVTSARSAMRKEKALALAERGLSRNQIAQRMKLSIATINAYFYRESNAR